MTLTPEQHKTRHGILHKNFDELLADFIKHTGKLLQGTNLKELMEWSHAQTIKPDD